MVGGYSVVDNPNLAPNPYKWRMFHRAILTIDLITSWPGHPSRLDRTFLNLTRENLRMSPQRKENQCANIMLQGFGILMIWAIS